MPKFQIEQYELHLSKYIVYAESEEEAIEKVYDGNGEFVENSTQFLNIAMDKGTPPSICSIEEIKV